jgi:hypothetical protein
MRNDRNVFRVIPVIHLKQVLLDCIDVADVRQNFYKVDNLHGVFTNAFKFFKRNQFIYKNIV